MSTCPRGSEQQTTYEHTVTVSCKTHFRGERAYAITGMTADGGKNACHCGHYYTAFTDKGAGCNGSEITHLTFQNVMKLAEWLPLPPPSPLLSNVLLPMPKLMLLQRMEWGAALWWSMLMSWTYSKAYQQLSTHFQLPSLLGCFEDIFAGTGALHCQRQSTQLNQGSAEPNLSL